MSLLLDTHILIWLAEGAEELPPSSVETINRAASAGLAVSAISFWEVAMLGERGRITISKPVRDWRADVLAAAGIREIPVTGDIAIESVLLPGDLHGDPADRMLVATARLQGLRLATRDRRLLDYGQAGYLGTVEI